MATKAPTKTNSQCFVKNICISDVETGIIVFQKVYKWKESSAFFNLGGLIQVFYQFAREVDDGEISCVNFESGRRVSSRLSQESYHSRNQTMQMKSIKTSDLIVSVFYDMQGMEMPTPEEDLKLDVLMNSVLEAFSSAHLESLFERRSTLQQYMDEQNAALDESDTRIVLPFEIFSSTADRLRRQLFPLQDGSFHHKGREPKVLREDVVLDENISVADHVRIQIQNLNSENPAQCPPASPMMY